MAETFTATADGNGQITISFNYGNSGFPTVNGVELFSGGTQILAINAGLLAGGTITVNPATFTDDATLQAINGETLDVSNLTNATGSTITVDGATLGLSGAWTNAAGGSITVTGGTLNLGDQSSSSTNAWSNAGTITASNTTVNLGGVFTLAGLGMFNQTADTVNLVGTLNNMGTTLALGSTTGSWNLAGGTITGGTLTEADGAELVLTQSGGTLDGVTVDGSLDGTQVNDAYAYVTDGLTLNGTAYLGDASGATYGGLYATNTETLSGTGTVVFGKNASNFLDASDPAVTLTIGSGITIRGSSGTIGGFYSNDTIINQGTISADDSGGLVGPFSYDTDFSGGSTEITGVSIDTSGVTDPAPQAVYQTERQGSFTYTLPGLTPGGSYAVQLDFADIDFAAAGQQQFNVDINGTQVLSNFDVFSAAGGQYKAVAETFTATADGNGQITISFNYGNSGFPTVNGVELFSGGTQILAINAGLLAGGTITVNPATFTDDATLQAINGETLDVSGSLTVDDPASLTTSNSGTILIGGSLLGNTNNATSYQMAGSLSFDGSGTSQTPQVLQAMSTDWGATSAGFLSNYAYTTLALANGTYLELVDESQNSNGSSAPEALYVENLVVPSGTTLNLNGLHLYAANEQVAGTVVGGAVFIDRNDAEKLAFLNVPTTGIAGQPLNPWVTVAVEDQFGNIISGNTSTVTLAVASGPGGFDSSSSTFAPC